MLLRQQLRSNKKREQHQCRRHERTLDGGMIYGIILLRRNSKKAKRGSRDAFLYIFYHITMDIQKQTLTEEPISPVPCSNTNAAAPEF